MDNYSSNLVGFIKAANAMTLRETLVKSANMEKQALNPAQLLAWSQKFSPSHVAKRLASRNAAIDSIAPRLKGSWGEIPTLDSLNGDKHIRALLENGEKPIRALLENGEKPIRALLENGKKPIRTLLENGEKPIRDLLENGEKPIRTLLENGDKYIRDLLG